MPGYLQPLKIAACALAASVTMAAPWIMLSTNPNTQSRPSIESPTVVRGAEDVQGLVRDSTISADSVDMTFEARWARATVSTTSVDLILAKAVDMSFESRWAQAAGRPVPLVVSDDLVRRQIVTGSVIAQFAKATPAATLSPANPVPLPPRRASEQAQGMPLPRPHSAQYETARVLASEPPPQVVTVAPPLLASAPEKPATPLEASNKLMSLPGRGSRTAVYDISARTVYLPNGERLEAHSGLGNKLDDPRYVNVRMRGPTPPNVYELALREELFHGVRAIRLNPIDDGKMFGRDGMLAHTYMLGANGQSNGCVSFKDYQKFLQAFLKGEVERLVVVPNLGTEPSVTARAYRGQFRRYAYNNR